MRQKINTKKLLALNVAVVFMLTVFIPAVNSQSSNLFSNLKEDKIDPLCHYILTIYIQGNGTVLKIPDQGQYQPGTIVELTALPDTGWQFDAWSDDLTGSENPINITMDSDKNVTATFIESQFTLTIHTDGSGTIIRNPDQDSYPPGTIVTLNAQPCPWWQFSHWSGDLTGTENPINVTMDSDKNITGHFVLSEYSLTIIIDGNGSVDKDPDQTIYTAGTLVNLTAIPDEGWIFTHWSGDLSGNENPTHVVMNHDKTITAHFFVPQYNLSIEIEGNGTVQINPDKASYPVGTVVEITAIPDEGWSFDHWSGDATGSDNPITIIMDSHKNIIVYFTLIEDQKPPIVNIDKPVDGIYIFNKKIVTFAFPLVIRGVTIEAKAVDEETGIERVEFYVDGELRHTDTEAPYSWPWDEDTPRNHVLKVTAYDNAGNDASQEVSVWKWKFHPILVSAMVIFAILKYRQG